MRETLSQLFSRVMMFLPVAATAKCRVWSRESNEARLNAAGFCRCCSETTRFW